MSCYRYRRLGGSAPDQASQLRIGNKGHSRRHYLTQ